MDHYTNLPQIKQRSPEWYQKKNQILTSTQIASLLHLNSFHTYQDLLNQNKYVHSEPTQITSINDIDPITWGTNLESKAISVLEDKFKSDIAELGLKIHDQYQFLGASPDGLQMINGQPRLIEIKCPQKREITYRVPVEYWVQTQIAMEVWNIDQCLYAEFKFEMIDTPPTGAEYWGKITKGIYWKYQDSWLYEIKRDRVWFNKILPQIQRFYHLKFQKPNFNIKPFKSLNKLNNNNQRITRSMTKNQSNNKKLVNNNQNDNNKKLVNNNQNDNNNQLVNKNCYDGGNQLVNNNPLNKNIKECQHTENNLKLMSVNKISNYLRNDPILDWLDIHGTDNDFQKEKSLFLNFYNQKNLYFKCQQVNRLIAIARQENLSFHILNPSLASLLDLYQNNVLLKLNYDIHLIKETQELIKAGADMIFMGQLGCQVKNKFVWDTFDVIVKRSAFKKLFRDHPFMDSNDLTTDDFLNSLDYIPIKIKYTSIDCKKNSFELKNGKHRLDLTKIGLITSAVILDRKDQIGIIPKLSYDSDHYQNVLDAIDWLNQVKNIELDQVWPNMKNKHDSQWSGAKSQIAKNKQELTQIAYMSYKNRQKLHQQGIFRIDDLTTDDLEELQYSQRIMPFLSDKLYLPPLSLEYKNPNNIEIYLDFESTSSLSDNQPLIFLTGVLVKYGDGKLEYTPYLVKHLNKESESEMLEKVLLFLDSLGPNTPVFHWSFAEPTMLKKAGYELSSN